jgi:hypothetical protein
MRTFLALVLLMGELSSVVMASDRVPALVPAKTPSDPAAGRQPVETGLPVVGLRELYLSAWEAAAWLTTNRTDIDESDFLPKLGTKGHVIGEARSPGASGAGSESSSSGDRLLLSVVNPQNSEMAPGQGRGSPTGSRPVLRGFSSRQSQAQEASAGWSEQVLVLSNRVVELQLRVEKLERKLKEVPQERGGRGKSPPGPRTAGDGPPKH